MDLKQLLGKLDLIEGTMKGAEQHSTGPKFTGYWKGSDAGTPGTKMVGGSEEYEESILKDLSKGPKPKTKEKELAEQFEAFLQALEEENLGVNEKRPARDGSRPAREYEKTGEHSKRYKYNKEETDESKHDPYKIISDKLKDIERQQKPQKPYEPSAEDLKRREEQAKADYRKYVAKMKKKNPNYIPLYKMDEAGADQPQGTAGQKMLQQDPKQIAATNQALQSIKAGTQSSAPTPMIAKALDAASQGKPVGQQDMKNLEPMMKDLSTVAQDPKLASQFKTLAQQIQQVQQQQQKP